MNPIDLIINGKIRLRDDRVANKKPTIKHEGYWGNHRTKKIELRNLIAFEQSEKYE